VSHCIRGTKSVKYCSELEVSVDRCRKMSTRAGSVLTTFVVILSFAGSIMKLTKFLLHGGETVSYVLLQD
jgi:hypothetical protein